jgi:pimeloyl-ACP methyl ester carboxylesterase
MTKSLDNPEKRRAVIIKIHGTNDGVPGRAGDIKWWEKTSDFVGQLTTLLSQRGLSPEIDEHVWGGANSAFARQKGAAALVRKLRRYTKDYDEVHLIGHSHGGNVAVDAARRTSWGKERGGRLFGAEPVKITSLTTVGTPFLRAQARGSDYLYALAFVTVMFVTVLTFAIAPAITLASALGFFFQEADPPPPTQIVLSVLSSIFLVIAALLLRNRWGHFRWIAGLMKHSARRANLLSIWHTQDEAIGGLKRAEQFQPILLQPGSLWSGGHRIGAKIGSLAFVMLGLTVVAFMIAMSFAALLPDVAFSDWVTDQIVEIQLGGIGRFYLIGTLSVIGLLAGFLVALGLYAVVRLLFGALPELLLRGILNAGGVGVLRAFAFGSDTGQPIGNVSERPHFYEGDVWPVPSPLAEKMADETLTSLTQFLARHRTSLFGVSMTAEWMTEMGQDAETWNSLIHTTYFDHTEIAERIAAHIAGAWEVSQEEADQLQP